MGVNFSRTALLIALSLYCSSYFSTQAQCRKAKLDEVTHGANEFIVLYNQHVRELRGQFFLSNDEPAGRLMVVEIYKYPRGSSDYADIYSVVGQRSRIKACVTRDDGKFFFPNLKSGRYLLRAGTLMPDGINEIHVILTVSPKTRQRKPLKIYLSLGT